MHARYYFLPRQTIFGNVYVLDYKLYLADIPTSIMHGAGALLIGIWIANVTYNTQPLQRRPYVFVSIIALLMSIALAEVGKRYMIWPHDPAFPSGHETFASSVAASLCKRDYRWLPLCIVSCILLGWAMVALHAHTPFELAAGTLLGSLTTICVMRFAGRTSPVNTVSSPIE